VSYISRRVVDTVSRPQAHIQLRGSAVFQRQTVGHVISLIAYGVINLIAYHVINLIAHRALNLIAYRTINLIAYRAINLNAYRVINLIAYHVFSVAGQVSRVREAVRPYTATVQNGPQGSEDGAWLTGTIFFFFYFVCSVVF